MLERISQEWKLLYSTKAQSLDGKRITYLDMVRGIAIFLVVAGHSGLIGHDRNIWLSTFHLPAFFFISGMLMCEKKEEETPFAKILTRKVKGIFLPYLWFSVGSVLVDGIQVFRGKLTADMIKEHTIQTVTLQGCSVLWFLPVLFLAELLTLSVIKLGKRILTKRLSVALATAVATTLCAIGTFYGYHALSGMVTSALLMGEIRILSKALVATAFISYGYLAGGLLIGKKKKESSEKNGVWAWVSGFCWPGLLVGVALSALNVLLIPYVQLMDFNNMNLGNPMIYLSLGLTGTLGVLFLCKSIPNIPLITFYGQNSLIIMCTHLNFYVMNVGMIIGRDVFVPLPGPDGLQFIISSLVCTMLLEIPVILVIRIFFPFVLGKKYAVPRKKQKA